MSKYYYVTYGDINTFLNIVELKEKYDSIIAIHRGGLTIGVSLSHKLKIPLHIIQESFYDENINISSNNKLISELTDKNILLVDDISDTGKTLNTVSQKIKNENKFIENIYTLTYCIKINTKFTPTYYKAVVPDKQWVIFPWEDLEKGRN